jgi:hypothetical protein
MDLNKVRAMGKTHGPFILEDERLWYQKILPKSGKGSKGPGSD